MNENPGTKESKMIRTDTHRPSVFDPAEYEAVGEFDNHHEDGFYSLAPEHNSTPAFDGNNAKRNRCDHCGSGPLRYGVVFFHAKSGELVTVGLACANRLGLDSRSAYDLKKQGEQIARERKVREWVAAAPVNAEVHEFLRTVVHSEDAQLMRALGVRGSTYSFLFDLLHKLNRYGSLSEKQVAAVQKIMGRAAERQSKLDEQAESMANVAPLAEGRRDIEGEVLSHRYDDTAYGITHKMLVKLDDGTKVWGTVPSAIEDAIHRTHLYNEDGTYVEIPAKVADLKGARVKFTATVERSKDDQHFGFFKRPSKAQVS